jgi:maltodextrin utilization protein YvdJ
MFEFKLPMVVKDVYESEMDRIVENIVHDKLDDENLKDKPADSETTQDTETTLQTVTEEDILKNLGNNIIDLRSVLFTLGE